MSNSLFMFNVQGSVWINQAQNVLYAANDIIKITSQRNQLTDSDVIGIAGGNCPDPGWYSITLASLKNNRPNAIVAGDVLKVVICSEHDMAKQLYDLGSYTVTADDVKMGGVVLDFDLGLQGA
jgi:hypothetical protein